MRKIAVSLALCLLLAGCGQTGVQPEAEPAPEASQTPAVVLPEEDWEEALEPEVPSGGLYLLESVPVLDPAAEEMTWEDKGDYRQSVLWSPNGSYVAIARTTETEVMVTVLEPVKSAYWHMTMPDGSTIPEGVALPEEDWGRWTGNDTLLVTLGGVRGGAEESTYRCSIRAESGRLKGTSTEQTTKRLAGIYDFDHDGVPENMELVTLLDPEVEGRTGFYELQISRKDGTRLWTESAHRSHPGWTSIFACEIDGEDYLLRYNPGMWQGWAVYHYQLFALDSANPGTERLLRESTVVWDCNFNMAGHQLHIPALADFLREVHGYLDSSTLLMSTENGEFRTSGSGAEFDDGFLEQWRTSEGDQALLEEALTAGMVAAGIEQGIVPAEE